MLIFYTLWLVDSLAFRYLRNVNYNTLDCNEHLGWDTDEFLTDIGEATKVMLSVVKNVSKTPITTSKIIIIITSMAEFMIMSKDYFPQGGLAPGGFNFDAKLLVLISMF